MVDIELVENWAEKPKDTLKIALNTTVWFLRFWYVLSMSLSLDSGKWWYKTVLSLFLSFVSRFFTGNFISSWQFRNEVPARPLLSVGPVRTFAVPGTYTCNQHSMKTLELTGVLGHLKSQISWSLKQSLCKGHWIKWLKTPICLKSSLGSQLHYGLEMWSGR